MKFAVKLPAQCADVRRWERILTFLTLFLSTGIVLLGFLLHGPILPGDEIFWGGPKMPEGSAEANLVSQIVWAGLYTVFVVLACVRRQRLLTTLLRERNICLLVGLAILSTLWSDSPSLTLWNCAKLIATTFFGIYLAKTYSLEEIFRMVAWATALSAMLSIVFALALPRYGLDDYMGQSVWRGIFDNKNELGRAMVLGAFTWLICALGGGRPRWLGALMFAVCSILVVLSTSKTSLVLECVLVLLLFAIAALGRAHRSVGLLVGLCLIGLVTLFIVEVNHPIQGALSLLDRDENLTGRTQIWPLVLEDISKHPWLGYGYMAFWDRGTDVPDPSLNGWSYAHNGFLDLGLEFGVIGPVLFVFALAGPVRRAASAALRRNSPVELFPLMFLLYMVLSNLTEGMNVTPNTIAWELFVVFCVRHSTTQAQLRQVWRRRRLEIKSSSWNPPAAAAAKSVA